jgi:hypothetical protein
VCSENIPLAENRNPCTNPTCASSHPVHGACIETWLHKRGNCPACRLELRQVEPKDATRSELVQLQDLADRIRAELMMVEDKPLPRYRRPATGRLHQLSRRARGLPFEEDPAVANERARRENLSSRLKQTLRIIQLLDPDVLSNIKDRSTYDARRLCV